MRARFPDLDVIFIIFIESGGGNLEMNATGRPDVLPRERGKLILFPSYQVHRVKYTG